MKPESEVVHLYVSAYGNDGVFGACLDSFLRQTYTNLRVHVFDDGVADGIESIRDLVHGKSDPRIIYHANPIRFGMPANDVQLFDHIDPAAKAMVLPGDMGLADDAVEKLLSLAADNSAQAVRASGESHDFTQLITGHPYDFGSPLQRHPAFFEDERVVECSQILERYYGTENSRGDLFSFSFYGALFDGALMKKFDGGYRRFSFHGFEQYLSMQLALAANRVAFTPLPLLHDLVGQPRLGGHYRPVDAISRLECLEAGEQFIRRNFFALRYRDVDVDSLRMGQIEKARYFLDNFDGYRAYVEEIIKRNLQIIGDRPALEGRAARVGEAPLN